MSGGRLGRGDPQRGGQGLGRFALERRLENGRDLARLIRLVGTQGVDARRDGRHHAAPSAISADLHDGLEGIVE